MLVLEMQVMAFRVGRRVAALFANVDLIAALFVRVVMSKAMHLECV
jgi:hypothetical protein